MDNIQEFERNKNEKINQLIKDSNSLKVRYENETKGEVNRKVFDKIVNIITYTINNKREVPKNKGKLCTNHFGIKFTGY